MTAFNPLLDGDGIFPPKLQGHPNWVYDAGRIATPWASSLEPEGLRPSNQGSTPEQGGTSSSMPKAAPSHGPKRARTDEARSTAASSSSQSPLLFQPEAEPVRASWMEVPVPEGSQEYSYLFFKPDNKRCRSVLLPSFINIFQASFTFISFALFSDAFFGRHLHLRLLRLAPWFVRSLLTDACRCCCACPCLFEFSFQQLLFFFIVLQALLYIIGHLLSVRPLLSELAYLKRLLNLHAFSPPLCSLSLEI